MSAEHDPYVRVRAFLADAGVPASFAASAFARIEAQDGELGDSFLREPLADLVRELGEEAHDLAAWSALLAARLEHDAIGSHDRRRARALLTAITQRAGAADALIGELQRLLDRAR